MKTLCKTTAALALGAAFLMTTDRSHAQDAPPFGDDDSVAFSQQLWEALKERDLVGEDALRSYA